MGGHSILKQSRAPRGGKPCLIMMSWTCGKSWLNTNGQFGLLPCRTRSYIIGNDKRWKIIRHREVGAVVELNVHFDFPFVASILEVAIAGRYFWRSPISVGVVYICLIPEFPIWAVEIRRDGDDCVDNLVGEIKSYPIARWLWHIFFVNDIGVVANQQVVTIGSVIYCRRFNVEVLIFDSPLIVKKVIRRSDITDNFVDVSFVRQGKFIAIWQGQWHIDFPRVYPRLFDVDVTCIHPTGVPFALRIFNVSLIFEIPISAVKFAWIFYGLVNNLLGDVDTQPITFGLEHVGFNIDVFITKQKVITTVFAMKESGGFNFVFCCFAIDGQSPLIFPWFGRWVIVVGQEVSDRAVAANSDASSKNLIVFIL